MWSKSQKALWVNGSHFDICILLTTINGHPNSLIWLEISWVNIQWFCLLFYCKFIPCWMKNIQKKVRSFGKNWCNQYCNVVLEIWAKNSFNHAKKCEIWSDYCNSLLGILQITNPDRLVIVYAESNSFSGCFPAEQTERQQKRGTCVCSPVSL